MNRRILNPSVSITTEPDTDSSEITGEEDLSEALDFPYEKFLRWAALRAQTYRESVELYATVARSHREQNPKHPATVAESEWAAEEVTRGLTKSYPFEAPLIQFVLQEKSRARH